ncbi:MAG: hypothetical protein EP335_06880 [Alphaproteobacteria bacterium]|nr:MAG: hypothetical protein EP335_06880 [Alphaproteobacteria bacterium]
MSFFLNHPMETASVFGASSSWIGVYLLHKRTKILAVSADAAMRQAHSAQIQAHLATEQLKLDTAAAEQRNIHLWIANKTKLVAELTDLVSELTTLMDFVGSQKLTPEDTKRAVAILNRLLLLSPPQRDIDEPKHSNFGEEFASLLMELSYEFRHQRFGLTTDSSWDAAFRLCCWNLVSGHKHQLERTVRDGEISELRMTSFYEQAVEAKKLYNRYRHQTKGSIDTNPDQPE